MKDLETRRANTQRVGRKRKIEKRKKRIKIFYLTIAFFALVIIIGYVSGAVYYRSHYLKGTVINGIDVSGMTFDELKETIKSYELTIKERGKGEKEIYVEQISGNDIGIEIISNSGLEEILEEQSVLKWFTKSGKSYEKETLIDYDKELLAEKIKSLKGFSEEHAVKPSSAYISEYNTKKGYEIIPEQQGNFLNLEATEKAVNEAVYNLMSEIDLDEQDCYEKPEVDSGDKGLNKLLSRMNKLVSVQITYNFDGEKEQVDGRNISQGLVINKNKVSLDREKVEEFVATLRKKYDTIFRARTFKTSYGESVTIDEGDYGWWMNYVQETEELADQIEAGKSGERKPVYYQTAANYGSKDYGDTYVEINLTAQHLFLYKDGKIVLESDFVSGNTSLKMGTPAGIYGITYKERYSVLVGETYESTASYWMPFNKDIGLHDAIWKTQFGSDFYKTDGSHGCINLPYLVAKAIYAQVEKGTPVICYKLKGTGSDSVTVQSYEEIAQAAIEAIDAIGTVTKDSQDEIEAARHMYDKIGKKAQEFVENYNVLTKAEKEFKKLMNNQ